jgi:hypothetical protein
VGVKGEGGWRWLGINSGKVLVVLVGARSWDVIRGASLDNTRWSVE